MSSTGTNFVANKDTILKEGYFKKRNFKGELGRAYSRRWCVLSARYFEWYDHPNGTRKQTIPLDHCYTRIHEGTGLIVGSFQTNKEWLLRDEGASPAATAAEWLEAINKAIENYRNVSGSSAASAPGQKGLVPLAEMLAKNQQAAAPMGTTQVTATPGYTASPAQPLYTGAAPTTVSQTITTNTPTYSPAPAVHTNYMNPAPAPMMQQTTTSNFGYGMPTQTTTTYAAPAPAFPTYAPAPVPVQTYVQQPVMTIQQPTYVQPMMTVQPTFVAAPTATFVTAPPTMTYTTYNPMY